LKRFVKALALALGVLLVALFSAGVWFYLAFDPNHYRGRIAEVARETTGRELAIDGDLRVKLFPRLAVEVGAVRLAQPEGFGAPPFASVARADADVRLLPLLLRGDVEVGRLRLEGLAVELRREADGATNWADLGPQMLHAAREARGADIAGEAADARAEGEAGGAMASGSAGANRTFHIGAAEIEGASVRYVDAQARREILLRDGSLRTGSFTLGEPFAVETRFRLDQGGLSADVQGRGHALVDAGPRFELREAVLDVVVEDMPPGAGTLGVRIEAPSARYASADLQIERPRLEIKSGGGSHIHIEGSFAAAALALGADDALAVTTPAIELALAGDAVPGGRAELKAQAPALEASLEKRTLRMEDVSGEAYGLTLRASVAGERLGDASMFAGRIALAPFSPRALVERLGYAQGATADPQALTRAKLDAQYSLSQAGLRLYDMHLELDDTTIAGEVAVTDFLRRAVHVDLAADSIVLDRYLPPAGAAPANTTEEFPFTSENLRSLHVDGSLLVADLQLGGLRSTDVLLRAGD